MLSISWREAERMANCESRKLEEQRDSQAEVGETDGFARKRRKEKNKNKNRASLRAQEQE
jgi:hypothetical protein